MGILTAIFNAIGKGLADFGLGVFRERERDRNLLDLGWNKGEVERLRKNQEIARKARKKHAEPTPTDVDSILDRL